MMKYLAHAALTHAAVLSTLVLGVACAHHVAPLARDEVRGSVYAVQYGFQTADKACADIAQEDIERLDLGAARTTAGACASALDDYRGDMASNFAELATWTPDSARAVACRMPSAVKAIVQMKAALAARGVALDTVDDAETRAKWLAAQCRR
jgi:hypothetical protein